jgi:hypothetical protein
LPRGSLVACWVKVHIPGNSYFNFYNAPAGQARTCIKVEQHTWDNNVQFYK